MGRPAPPTSTASPGTPTASTSPWAVISAYYQDITTRDYAAAWTLLGPPLQSHGYANFVAGYSGTGHRAVTKISESGNQVSFTLRSDNPDGTVQTYQGTDTITGGKITAATIVQTG